jgi:formylglycine-generating enzyme required for sulfatase activity
MGWPRSQDYNEAVQAPDLCFADEELRAGQVVINALGLPMPYSGNFADVYEVRGTAASLRWAVKCFTRETPALRERYMEISRHLRQARMRFTVDFNFLEQGIRIANQWYPVLKMEWVEGLTLNQFVARHVDNPTMLEALLSVWRRMARHLRAADVGHGDLQHGNVLLVPAASANSVSLKLIDYDGMWVPALAELPSGEVGHSSYQHPQRLREATYGPEVDRFPLLVVATGLRALKVGGRALWEKYDNGDNLLFRREDFDAPSKSALIYDLLKLDDPSVRFLAENLIDAARNPLDQTPLLEELISRRRGSPVERDGQPARPGVAQMQQETSTSPEPQPDSSEPNDEFEPRRRVVPAFWIALAGTVAFLGIIVLVIVLFGDSLAGDSNKETSFARQDSSGDRKQTEPMPNKFKNSLGIEFVLIPAGRFLMGSPKDEVGRIDEEGREHKEGPQHEVEITMAFYMGAYPVTKGQFGAFVKDAGYQMEADKDGKGGWGYNAATRKLERDPKYNWKDPGFTQTDDHPVVNVSWNDATAFCAWLSKKEGETYELPTEAEWEYACRAGTKTRFWCGDTDASLQGNVNIGDASLKEKGFSDVVSWNDGYPFTSPVGTFKANPWGLYDMSGNVWQWCADYYGPYQAGYMKDPQGAASGNQRVLRGGSWLGQPRDCRSARRHTTDLVTHDDHYGFRIVSRFAPPR